MGLGWCPGRQLAPEARSEASDFMQRTVLGLLVTISREADRTNKPFQTPSCFLNEFAQRVRVAPFGR